MGHFDKFPVPGTTDPEKRMESKEKGGVEGGRPGYPEKLDKRDLEDIERGVINGSEDPRAGYAANYQYTPRELRAEALSRGEEADFRGRQRDAKMEDWQKYYDNNINLKARDMKAAGESDEAIAGYRERRAAGRDAWVARETQNTLELWGRQDRAADLRRRIQDMERGKPEDVRVALRVIDDVWDAIDEALGQQAYDHRHHGLPDDARINKAWGNYVLPILNSLRDQIRFEGSVSRRSIGDLSDAVGDAWRVKAKGDQLHVEAKWKSRIEAVRNLFREFYIETPEQERERRMARDSALEKYLSN